jgi:hypothetical protein
MSLPIPAELIYDNVIQSLPNEYKASQEILAASGLSVLKDSGYADFILPTTNFLNQKSLLLKFNYALTGAIGVEIVGTPSYTFIYRIQITCGSYTESISNYNVCQNLRVNITHDPAQKYGMQPMYGYNNTSLALAGIPSLETLDGKKTLVLNETGYACVPFDCSLYNANQNLPLFGMPQVQIRVFFESATNIATSTVAPTGYTISDMGLCYELVDMGRAYEQELMKQGTVDIKTVMWDTSTQTQASWAGTADIAFSVTKKWIKSAFVLFQGTSANSKNKLFDAYDFSSDTGEISLNVGGQIYPNTAAILMLLKQAVGNFTDRNNSMSINFREAAYIADVASSYDVPAKCYFGFNLNRFQREENTEFKKAICSGVSTNGRQIVVRATTATAPATTYNVCLITVSDVIMRIDLASKTCILIGNEN